MEKNILETYAEHAAPRDLQQIVSALHVPAVFAHHQMHIHSLEALLEKPLSIKADKVFDDLRGFVDYIGDFKSDNTVIFTGKDKITACFDYHGKDDPRWNRHTATYNLTRSERWKAWLAKNNAWMTQRDFCDFLEGGVNEVVVPTQAEILDLAKNFRATSKMEVVSDIRSGNTLSFTGSTKGGAANKDVEIPEYIEIAVAPYTGLESLNGRLDEADKFGLFQIKTRLAFSLDDTAVRFKYVLVGIENTLDKQAEGLRQVIIKLTGVKTYIG